MQKTISANIVEYFSTTNKPRSFPRLVFIVLIFVLNLCNAAYTADETVTLTNDISGGDAKTLGVTFTAIEQAGNNNESKTYTSDVSVAAMPANALFGTWSGKFNYYVEIADAIETVMFYDVEYELNGDPTKYAQGYKFGSDGLVYIKNTNVWEDDADHAISTYTTEGQTIISGSSTWILSDDGYTACITISGEEVEYVYTP